MTIETGWGVEGLRCVAAARLIHQLRGKAPTVGSALEVKWHDGQTLLLDVNTDLTLMVSRSPWRDPYAGCSDAQRSVLAEEVGLWTRVPVDEDDALAPILGATATSVEPIFDEVLDLAGVRVLFGSCVLSVEVIMDGLLQLDLNTADPASSGTFETWPPAVPK
ncbi:hypothetical protein [Cellulomonas oligotrophica]|uniref:Uncharacterized protein n=1 Tax=Cellulomonas oligotrophica TaxID=931536 RepID=A0A7Y9FIW6_9CELL|nr:hypothetical protein [Cellulomonas oligotrophica]NYD88079.1 hypothetical protein [Cellulomonas oligotrophica]GIG33586.1 hypothetical protein Col01nite_27450 [Cellulomonas oligotrophica]